MYPRNATYFQNVLNATVLKRSSCNGHEDRFKLPETNIVCTANVSVPADLEQTLVNAQIVGSLTTGRSADDRYRRYLLESDDALNALFYAVRRIFQRDRREVENPWKPE